MNNQPMVSVITPLYNGEAFVEETIKSVLAQTYNNFELLIVDDCSTDNGAKIVEKYTKLDKRIKFFKLDKNSGAGICRNKAIEESKGDYIAFLDSDDLWVQEKLEEQIKFMRDNNYNFTFTKYRYMTEEGELLSQYINVPKKIEYKTNLVYNPIGCLTVIYNSKNLGKVYMPNIKRGQDYALWLKILKLEKYGYGLNKSLSNYRIRKGSLSKNKFKKFENMMKIYSQEEGFNKLNSLIITLFYGGYKLIKERI